MKGIKLFLIIFLSTILVCSCTKLNETVGGNLTAGQVNSNPTSAVLLQGVYTSLEYTFTSYQEIFALSDMTTDETIAPTRGNNWDDNGKWRVMHQQKWDANNIPLHDCFHSLEGTVFAATDLLQYNPSKQQQAEARFLRAFTMYWLLDMFDQVPYREPGEGTITASKVRKGTDALNYIISEIDEVEPDLPDQPASIANKYAAKTLLMKCYLNKAVYANRAAPSFDAADMNKVISLADEIINSNKFAFSSNYFDNFSPDNANDSKENIFTQASRNDGQYVVSFAWLAPLGYNAPFGGFNGFTTLPDFYNKFEPGDLRRGQVYSYTNAPPNPANKINVGFLIGQQYDIYTGDAIGPDYTPDVENILPGPNLNDPGIRPIKYAPDYNNFYFFLGTASNNFVYLRFPDVLLMKAEAILRGGTATNAGVYGATALSIVNGIRTDPSRGVTAMTSLSLDDLFDERGRELWWENWRRQDMIRFGKFLQPFQAKDYQSDPKYLIFPIPNEQLAVNPNLKQNPGY